MATLQKIRSNKITQFAIGAGMLAFIAGSAVEIMKSQAPDTEVMSLNGESLDYAELNDKVEDYKNALQIMGQLPAGEQVSNEVMAQIREQVYQQYVQEKLLEAKCEKLGLTVTTTELQDIIKNGESPLLAQTPFRTQQGTFDYPALQQFLKQRDEAMKNGQISAEQREQLEQIYRYWCFIENEVKKNALSQKFGVLSSSLIMSNPVSAKASFDARTNESTLLVASLPYSTISDDEIKVEDKEIEAKFKEYKEMTYQTEETRDIKYIDVVIEATQGDRDALHAEMEGYAASLQKENVSVESVVRQSQSSVAYASLPVSKTTLPRDIASRLDSMSVGQQSEVFYTISDNTMNIVKLLNKVTRPDSVEVRQLAVETQAKADSIVRVLNGGEPFDSIAKNLNQSGEKNWITSQSYEGQTMPEEYKNLFETITTSAVGETKTVDMNGAVVVLNITDRRKMEEKYDVAVIKRTADFSNETATDYFNKLNTFLANNKTIEEMEKNQGKDGYVILTSNDLTSMMPGLQTQFSNVADSREVIRWAFKKETKTGEISDIMYCGKNREHLVVAALTAIHPEGCRDAKDEQVKSFLTNLVMTDKKAAKLQEQMSAAKSIAEVAKMKGATCDTIQHVSFAYNTSVAGNSEAVVSGAAQAKKGSFVNALRGNGGVYAVQVLDKNTTDEKYDEKAEMERVAQTNMRNAGVIFQASYQNPSSIFYSDYKNAKREDKRHLFY